MMPTISRRSEIQAQIEQDRFFTFSDLEEGILIGQGQEKYDFTCPIQKADDISVGSFP
jgi:hypothetical protein